MARHGHWHETLATFALVVWTMLAGYVLFVYVLVWVARSFGPFEWSMEPVPV